MLCLQHGDVMTLLLHYWLVLSGDSLLSFCWQLTGISVDISWIAANGLMLECAILGFIVLCILEYERCVYCSYEMCGYVL